MENKAYISPEVEIDKIYNYDIITGSNDFGLGEIPLSEDMYE